METIINVSELNYLNDLEKAHIETESYLSILKYLLNINYDVNHQNYQYYEKLYLDSYFNLFNLKQKLETYIKQKLTLKSFSWQIDFEKKEVIINE